MINSILHIWSKSYSGQYIFQDSTDLQTRKQPLTHFCKWISAYQSDITIIQLIFK